MSRRNTYLLGGLAVLAGIVLLVVAISSLSSDGDDSPPATETNAPERQITPGSPTPPSGDTGADQGGGRGNPVEPRPAPSRARP